MVDEKVVKLLKSNGAEADVVLDASVIKPRPRDVNRTVRETFKTLVQELEEQTERPVYAEAAPIHRFCASFDLHFGFCKQKREKTL